MKHIAFALGHSFKALKADIKYILSRLWGLYTVRPRDTLPQAALTLSKLSC